MERRHLRRPRAARHRSRLHLRPRPGPRGRSPEPPHLVCRGRLGRGLEDGRRRHDLEPDLRLDRRVLGRLRDDRPQRSADRLGGERREQQPAQRLLRRRRLQIGRRRRELGERRAQGLRAHREDRRRSARLEDRLRRRPGAAVVGGRRPRALQDDGRRQELEAGAPGQREHRRQRSGARPPQPRRALCRRLPAPAPRLDADRRRPGERHLQDGRRRSDLEEARRRPAQGRDGAHRPRHLAAEPRRGLRRRRGGRRRRRSGGLLPLGRRRLALGEAQRRDLLLAAVLRQDRSPTRRASTAST